MWVSSISDCNHTFDSQIGLPLHGHPILYIAFMITDWIGLQSHCPVTIPNFSVVWDFSLGSESNPLEMKVAITWRGFQPVSWISARDENPSLLSESGLGFPAWANRLKNLQEGHVIEMEFQPGLKKQHAQWGCFPKKQNGLHFSLGWNFGHIIICCLCIVFQACLTFFMSILFLFQCFWALLVLEVNTLQKFYFQFGLPITIIKVLLYMIGVYYHGW